MPKELPRKKLLIFGCVVLVLLLALLISLIKQKQSLQEEMVMKQQEDQQRAQMEVPPSELPTTKVPQMTFSSYTTGNQTVTVPGSVKVYTFRSDYSLPYISIVGQKLGLNESKTEGNTVLLYNTTDETNRGYLKFDTNTGIYEYTSYGSQPIPQTAGSITANVQAYLADLGLTDETVTCNITYQRADIPDSTFVECHRDWNKVGLPIINFVGLLNVPDLQSLADLQVGMVDDELSPSDPDIINVSTGQNGMARPADFNTVTAVVDNEGNLVSITSNIKMVEASIDFSQPDLLTPEEAINQFRQGNSRLSLVVPVDDNLAWETVFPGNTANNLNAQVSDVMLAYVENPFSGKSLSPTYIARGTAETSSGYQVKFLQALPALKNQQSMSGEVAGLMAQATTPYPTEFYDESLKLGTFNPDQRVVPTVEPVNASCVPVESQLSPIVTLGEFGLVGQFTLNFPTQSPNQTDKEYSQTVRPKQWFLIPAVPGTLPEINSVISAFDALNLGGKADKIRELKKLSQEWEQYNLCPLRLTGASPTLFVYGKTGQEFQIGINRRVTYAYPLMTNNNWKVTTPSNSLYYEYLPVFFNKPETGWTVKKNEIATFAQKVGSELSLTATEIEKLSFELNLAAEKVDSNTLFIGPIPQTQVDKKVPLTVSPQIPVVRYHFYVDKADQDHPVSPQLTPVVRSTEMLLEVGASTP